MVSDYNILVDKLVRAFPGLQDKTDETIDWSGGILNHVIFGQVQNFEIGSGVSGIVNSGTE